MAPGVVSVIVIVCADVYVPALGEIAGAAAAPREVTVKVPFTN